MFLERFGIGVCPRFWRRAQGLAPQVGLEPTTLRLTAECSTIELLRSNELLSIRTNGLMGVKFDSSPGTYDTWVENKPVQVFDLPCGVANAPSAVFTGRHCTRQPLACEASLASRRRVIPVRLTPLGAFAYASPSATETPCRWPAGCSPTTGDPPVALPAANSQRSRKAAPARAGQPGFPPE